MSIIKNIAVFSASSNGNNPLYIEEAKKLGEALARHHIGLVYGGGNRGIMGVLAHSVYDNHGSVLGVLPTTLNVDKVTSGSVMTELIVTPDMHTRKKTMYERADAFIAFPGGIGTIEEISEIYTWRQLGLTNKNLGLYNINNYWDSYIALLDNGVKEGFISPLVRDILIISSNPEEMIDKLKTERKEIPSKI